MAEATKPKFDAELIKASCPSVLYPPKVARKSLLWGFRLNGLDLTSTRGYRWPFPGLWATASGPFTDTDDPCPTTVGDGLCVAHTIRGALSGGARLGVSVGLLVAWLPKDVLADSPDKARVKRAWVAEMFDPMTVLRGADLRGAYLGGAYLGGADLRGAYLGGAYLRGAYLRGAYLRGAYLGGAYLGGAYLGGADLGGAYLGGADLGGAYLGGAYLGGAKYSQLTLWPAGFDPKAAGAIEVK